jgi:hypothetical protein
MKSSTVKITLQKCPINLSMKRYSRENYINTMDFSWNQLKKIKKDRKASLRNQRLLNHFHCQRDTCDQKIRKPESNTKRFALKRLKNGASVRSSATFT